MSRQQRRAAERAQGKAGHVAYTMDPDDPRIALAAEAWPLVVEFTRRHALRPEQVLAVVAHPDDPLARTAPPFVPVTESGARVIVGRLADVLAGLTSINNLDGARDVTRRVIVGASILITLMPGRDVMFARFMATDNDPVAGATCWTRGCDA